jgi:hypothetical protein
MVRVLCPIGARYCICRDTMSFLRGFFESKHLLPAGDMVGARNAIDRASSALS